MLNANILTNRCPRCRKNGISTESESGETFCSECGLVLQGELLASHEPCSLPDKNQVDEAWSGEQVSTTLYDMGHSGTIGHGRADAAGKPIRPMTNNMMERLRVQDKRSRIDEQTRLRLAPVFVELSRLKDKLGAPDAAIDRAAYLCRKAIVTGVVFRKPILGLAASALYAACRENGAMRTLNEVCAASNIGRKDIIRHYKLLVKELDLKIPAIDPVVCSSMVASKIGLPENIRRFAADILNDAKKNVNFAGKRPLVLAGSALYIACSKHGNETTMTFIANSAGVTVISLTTTVKRMKRCLNL